MDKYDFTNVVDFIFKNKDKYDKLTDVDKESVFFIINRKFAREYPIHAEFFNKKNIDKSTALDIWFSFFNKNHTNNIPQWYWFKKSKSDSISSIIKKTEIEYIMDLYDITEDDVKYLAENNIDDLKDVLKKIRKFE